MIKKGKLRFERVDTCKECNSCKSHTACNEARVECRNYTGIRLTSDGFDCALPVSIDTHSVCSFGCLYCFSDNLVSHRENTVKKIGQVSLGSIEKTFAGEPSKFGNIVRRALKYDKKKNGYPCPIQVGAITDPCDNIERQQGFLLGLLDLALKYKQPLRFSTKGKIFLTPEYFKSITRDPRLFWVAFSIISTDDELLAKIDKRAPSSKQRFASMKKLSKAGVKTSLRFRPIMPGISDRTKNRKGIWREMVHRAKESGAESVSCEVGFYPGATSREVKARWDELAELTGIYLKPIYKNFGRVQPCIRPAYTWTEEIMHRIKEECNKVGVTFGVSDPVWKQLTESGCCCGIQPDDPVFGNWERENATNALVTGRDSGKLIHFKDVVPGWAFDCLKAYMCNQGVGPTVKYDTKHDTWADKLRRNWNDLATDRGPLRYFQGALIPARRDKEGNIIYKYAGLRRQNLKTETWRLN